MKNSITKYAVVNALLTTLYIVLVSSFVFYVPKALGLNNKPDSIMAPIVMLSLLVFSASLVGVLIFGRPVMWYLDGKKKEAMFLLGYTLIVFFVITVAVFISLVAYTR